MTDKKQQDVSEENIRLQDEINTLMEVLKEDDYKQYRQALETLRNLIRTSTTSMTNVPFPLKYMRNHYPALKEIYSKMRDGKTQKLCADIISVVSMAMVDSKELEGKHECLKYCLLGLQRDVGDWGHEYIRQLEGEIAEEWVSKDDAMREKLLPLIMSIIQFDTKHNAEIQACDLLMEINRLDVLEPYVDASNYMRICQYLTSCSMYVEELELAAILNVVMDIYLKFKEYPRALCLAIQMNDKEKMSQIFELCNDPSVLKQLAFIAARQLVIVGEDQPPELLSVMSNAQLSDHFHSLAKELDILEPKSPEEVYKSWLENSILNAPILDSARQNLASSLVNAFVNAGFCTDKLVTVDDGKNWIYRNKDRGMLTAAASLGLIYLWDIEGGLTPIDRYFYTNEDNIKSGSLLAVGIVNCGVRSEFEPAKALLTEEYVLHESNTLRIGAILGLGLAYAGSNQEDVLKLLRKALLSETSTPEVIGLSAIACGLIAVGSCNDEVVTDIIKCLLELSPILETSTYVRFLPLGLGLCFLGRKEMIEVSSAALEVLSDPFKSVAQTTLQMCAYAGTADVLIIQEMLHICSEHFESEETQKTESTEKKQPKVNESKSFKGTETPINEDLSAVQSVAALGVAVIAIGEEIGNEMTSRIFGQLSRYGEPAVRRAVPLAIALTSVSNPTLAVIDVLSKFSHDSDPEVAQNAIFSMGLVGAGSNNARLATMLRQLAQYHAKNPSMLFMVRLAQGLTHLGKGTISLAPFHTDRQVLSSVALGGLLVVLTACLDVRNIVLGKSHYLLYCLVAAMHPRWLVTLDEDLNPLNVFVRVGQAVDIVGKAGCPKTITRGQTHTTPVLLGVGERAELATEEYIPLAPVMEGFVILRKNPDFEIAV